MFGLFRKSHQSSHRLDEDQDKDYNAKGFTLSEFGTLVNMYQISTRTKVEDLFSEVEQVERSNFSINVNMHARSMNVMFIASYKIDGEGNFFTDKLVLNYSDFDQKSLVEIRSLFEECVRNITDKINDFSSNQRRRKS